MLTKRVKSQFAGRSLEILGMLKQKCSKIEQEISEIQIYTSITRKNISGIRTISILVDFRIVTFYLKLSETSENKIHIAAIDSNTKYHLWKLFPK
jgi:hypothetical protein